MKKMISILACLVFFSLACLSTAESSKTPPAEKIGTLRTLTNDAQGVEAAKVETLRSAQSDSVCAVVIADRALNVRDAAGWNTRILYHLRKGDEVQVIDRSAADWWRVSTSRGEGWARASFLKQTRCNDGD
jgi:uncharacterized protein YgiM (DUF1202 family)